MTDLTNTWTPGIDLKIKPGNVLAIYTDDGPTGLCGQSMSTTSPHTYIFLFNSEDEFRENVKDLGRKGQRGKLRFVVVGNYGSEGIFSIEDLT